MTKSRQEGVTFCCVMGVVAVLALQLCGCVTPRPAKPYLELNEEFITTAREAEDKVQTIAVLPFTGPTGYTRVCGEMFAYYLQKHHPVELLGPTRAEVLLEEKGVTLSGERIELEDALLAGRLLKVDAVAFGGFNLVYRGDLVLGVSVYDLSRGELIVTSMHSGKEGERLDRRKAVDLSARKVAYDVVSALFALEGKVWQAPEALIRFGEGEDEP